MATINDFKILVYESGKLKYEGTAQCLHYSFIEKIRNKLRYWLKSIQLVNK